MTSFVSSQAYGEIHYEDISAYTTSIKNETVKVGIHDLESKRGSAYIVGASYSETNDKIEDFFNDIISVLDGVPIIGGALSTIISYIKTLSHLFAFAYIILLAIPAIFVVIYEILSFAISNFWLCLATIEVYAIVKAMSEPDFMKMFSSFFNTNKAILNITTALFIRIAEFSFAIVQGIISMITSVLSLIPFV